MMRRFAPNIGAAVLLLCGATCVRAADVDAAAADASGVEITAPSNHMFGVLPNYMTADPGRVTVQTTHDAYKAASLSTFDPFVYPTVGLSTLFGSARAR